IARLEKAVRERSFGQGRVVEITQHAVGRADLQLAAGGDAEVNILGRASDAAEALRLLGRAAMEIAGTGLGQAIEVVDRGRRPASHDIGKMRRQHLSAGQYL